MKAAVYYEGGQPLKIENVDDPTPEADEVIIEVKHCGICGTDLHATEEHSPASPTGTIMGHEFAGEIVAMGKDAPEGWKVGDRLTTLPMLGCGKCVPCLTGEPWTCTQKKISGVDIPGGFSQYTKVDLNQSVKLPESVSWKEGALVEPLAIGLHAVRRAGNMEGKNILIVGGGPVGVAVALWVRFFGARKVVVSELEKGRAEMSLKYGATDIIDAKGDVGGQFAEICGGPPDVVYECVGLPGMIMNCLMLAPHRSTLVVVGFCTQPDTFVPALAMANEITMQFVVAWDKRDFQFVVDMIASDRIDVEGLITDVVSFDQFSDAFEALRKPEHQVKVLLDPFA
jgi:2-desacetyl-2-hydroxyethyl bacteriochlorophyllide A dehydrogenase